MFAGGYGYTVPPMVSLLTPVIGHWDAGYIGAPTSQTYESAQRAVYFPIVIPAPCVARRVWWANGATVSGGATIEVGIYASLSYAPGAKLVSGSATQGSASQVQFVDVTDTVLPPGVYWLAILSSSGTNTTFLGALTNTSSDAGERFQEASLGALPSTATPVEATVQTSYLFGFATTASP